ncbi:hypothetical protein BAUCODRAFT_36337 [Baudoinia panamericana UAMH 10762]|uniref:N-acetylglucosamine-induced protein 1 n=1 Tax=Baudoinia panamericana (strain UAMH 10762) TaxID=717646 RepID=M2N4D2_BAUPA|nr:uncharacterized protein BAUCODRAFT_36337 [Baudoinia panamericana UAMH 10762]EMC93879.1 hypothetical protein BAUCODRAFT_36337 [Baudoinia panamericana UAMH 10762]
MHQSAVREIDYDNPPFPLTAIDREILATKDEDYHRVTWDELRQITANNTLEQLKRLPSDLRRYLAWCYDIKNRYGSITTFVIQERLHWTPEPAPAGSGPVFAHHSDVPFADRRDYAVLPNDWPYGFEPGIKHLLVWSKTPIAVDDQLGDVTPESRRLIEEFVERHFIRALGEGGRDRVLWFKNWVKLQSVRGVDHVHVLVRYPPDDLLKEWTERDDI